MNNLEDIKTVVVGVDFSEPSRSLLSSAQWLCNKLGSALVIVRVEPVYPPVQPYPTAEGGLIFPDLSRAEPQEIEEQVRKFYSLSAEAKIEVSFGQAGDELERIASQHLNPILVIGHSSKGLVERLLSGSASRRLASRSHIPVLIM